MHIIKHHFKKEFVSYRLKLIIVASLLLPNFSFGQSIITGRVMDSQTKKPIKDASVTLVGTELKTNTNFLGYFQITADTTNELLISHKDYLSEQFKTPNARAFQVQLNKNDFPDFEGGISEFYIFLTNNLKYPFRAETKRTQGREYVSFVLDSLNGIQNINLINDIGDNCGEMIIKVLNKCPKKWSSKAKSVTLILPVTFQIYSDGNTSKNMAPIGTDIQLPKGWLLDEIVVTAGSQYVNFHVINLD